MPGDPAICKVPGSYSAPWAPWLSWYLLPCGFTVLMWFTYFILLVLPWFPLWAAWLAYIWFDQCLLHHSPKPLNCWFFVLSFQGDFRHKSSFVIWDPIAGRALQIPLLETGQGRCEPRAPTERHAEAFCFGQSRLLPCSLTSHMNKEILLKMA